MSKKLFIFGAGGSVHANGPLNKDWTERIKKNKDNSRDNKTAIDFLNGLQGFDNVEALLSFLDLSIIEKHNYLPLPGNIKYLKDVRTKLISNIINVAKEVVHDPFTSSFLNKVELKDGDTIINFNYDLLVDRSLFDSNLWNPYKGTTEKTCGYGFGISSLAI